MNNLYEFTENELREVDQLKKHFNVETRAQAIRHAITYALASLGQELSVVYADAE